MPKRKDPEKIVTTQNGTEYYKSRLTTTKKHNEKSYDTILLRIPAGSKESLTKWGKDRAEEEPDNPRYNDVVRNRASVNAFIVSLIEEETGLKLRN